MQALLVGLFLALAVGAFATTLRLDRDRAFYPTIMIVIAAYYVLFALMAASNDALPVELLVASLMKVRPLLIPPMKSAFSSR